jgi:hypothetical protein
MCGRKIVSGTLIVATAYGAVRGLTGQAADVLNAAVAAFDASTKSTDLKNWVTGAEYSRPVPARPEVNAKSS